MRLARSILVAGVVLTTALMVLAADNEFGPSGGRGGKDFLDRIPDDAKLVNVTIWSGINVDAIQITYRTVDGKLVTMDKHGGDGGLKHEIELGPGQHILKVSGKYGDVLDSIMLTLGGTDVASQGKPLGGDGGDVEYRYQAPPGMEISGFFGRCGDRVDALGVIIRPAPGAVANLQ